MSELEKRAERISRGRWRIATWLTVIMMLGYFGFILLIAFQKPAMGTLLTPGLSVGIPLGAGVIVLAWILTYIYIRWTNQHYDAELSELRRRHSHE